MQEGEIVAVELATRGAAGKHELRDYRFHIQEATSGAIALATER